MEPKVEYSEIPLGLYCFPSGRVLNPVCELIGERASPLRAMLHGAVPRIILPQTPDGSILYESQSKKSFSIDSLLGHGGERGIQTGSQGHLPPPSTDLNYRRTFHHFQSFPGEAGKGKCGSRYIPYTRREKKSCLHHTSDPPSGSKDNAFGSTHKPEKSKRVRTIFTPEQLEKLESEFERQQYMVGTERSYLAESLDLTEAQVKVWFQNRRIKWRKVHLEMQQERLRALRTQEDFGDESSGSSGSNPDSFPSSTSLFQSSSPSSSTYSAPLLPSHVHHPSDGATIDTLGGTIATMSNGFRSNETALVTLRKNGTVPPSFNTYHDHHHHHHHLSQLSPFSDTEESG